MDSEVAKIGGILLANPEISLYCPIILFLKIAIMMNIMDGERDGSLCLWQGSEERH